MGQLRLGSSLRLDRGGGYGMCMLGGTHPTQVYASHSMKSFLKRKGVGVAGEKRRRKEEKGSGEKI